MRILFDQSVVGGRVILSANDASLASPTAPTITTVGGDGVIRADEVGVPLTGTNLAAGMTVTLIDIDGREQLQGTVTVTDSGNAAFPVVRGALKYGQITVRVQTANGQDGRTALLMPPEGWDYVTLTSLDRFEFEYTGPAPQIGNQISYKLKSAGGATVKVYEHGGYSIFDGPDNDSFELEIHSG